MGATGTARRVVAIVQARMGSSRLPGKVLADLGGRPLLEVMLARTAAAARLDHLAVAVPDVPSDDDLAAAVAAWGYEVVRGPSDDVLERYRMAAELTGADVIVRLTGDCPLIDARVVDDVAAAITDLGFDYVSTGTRHPEGTNVEAFTRAALELAATEATLPSHREHASLFITDQPERFRLHRLGYPEDRGHVRLTVDEPADLDVVQALVERLGADPSIAIDAYADALEADPDLRLRNASIPRDEGLWLSRLADTNAQLGPPTGRRMSDEWLERAERVVPHATQTLSKAPDQFVAGVTPAFLRRGLGCHVWDVDGNAYVDFPMALGPILLGYGHPATVQSVTDQVREGTTFTLPHPLEVEVAERMVEIVPCAEMVRFAKNGSDATTAAVRLARAVTGRERVLVSGYHGWHDWYAAITDKSRGIPAAIGALIGRFDLCDPASLDAALDDGPPVAAVVIEIGLDTPTAEHIAHVKAQCERHGALFVWDEVVTGFRWSPGGAQQYYGVTPDLACFGKAMANGLPLSAVAGPSELMREFGRGVFFSGTFGGETLSLAAARATIDAIARGAVCQTVWDRGARFRSALADLVLRHGVDVEISGQPPRSALTFRRDGTESPELRGLFMQETVRRGVLFGGPTFVTWAHLDPDLAFALEAVDAALGVMAEALETDSVERRLDGPPPGVVFKPVRSPA